MKQLIATILILSSVSVASVDYYQLLKQLKKETKKVCHKSKQDKIKNKECRDNKKLIKILKLFSDNPEKQSVCALVYNPVCGVDGKTYSNSCFAAVESITVIYEGECL